MKAPYITREHGL